MKNKHIQDILTLNMLIFFLHPIISTHTVSIYSLRHKPMQQSIRR